MQLQPVHGEYHFCMELFTVIGSLIWGDIAGDWCVAMEYPRVNVPVEAFESLLLDPSQPPLALPLLNTRVRDIIEISNKSVILVATFRIQI